MKESSPEGNIKNYIIDDEGIARSQDGDGLESWIWAEYGKINTVIKLPPLQTK